MKRMALAVLSTLLLVPSVAHAEHTGYCWPGFGCVGIFYEHRGDGVWEFRLDNDPGVGLWSFYFMGLQRDWTAPPGVVDTYRLEFIGDDLGWSYAEKDGFDWGIERAEPLAYGTWWMIDPMVRDYGAPVWSQRTAFTWFTAGDRPIPPPIPSTTTPEPASLLLLGSGLLGLAIARRRKRAE